MSSYINFAIMAREANGGWIFVKDLTATFNSNILRDYFREKDYGTPLRIEDIGEGVLSPDCKDWIRKYDSQKLHCSELFFDRMIQDIKDDIKNLEERKQAISLIKVNSEEAVYTALNEITQLDLSIRGGAHEPGLIDIEKEIYRLKFVTQYIIEDFNFEERDLYSDCEHVKPAKINYGDGDVQLCWWIG